MIVELFLDKIEYLIVSLSTSGWNAICGSELMDWALSKRDNEQASQDTHVSKSWYLGGPLHMHVCVSGRHEDSLMVSGIIVGAAFGVLLFCDTSCFV